MPVFTVLSAYDVADTGLFTIFANPLPDVVDRYTLYPATPELGLAPHVNPTVGAVEVDVTPVALTGIVIVLSVALLTILIDPLIAPAAFGKNCAASVAFCPGAIVNGAVTPVPVNPVPLIVTADTEIFAFPVFCKTTSSTDDFPVDTFPKFKLAGLADKFAALVVPVPVK